MFTDKKVLAETNALKQSLETKTKALSDQIDAVHTLLASFKKKKKGQVAERTPVKKEIKPTPTEFKVSALEAKDLLKKSKLVELRKALEAVPDNASGFGGTTVVYDNTKGVMRLEVFKSKEAALRLVADAESGKISIVL